MDRILTLLCALILAAGVTMGVERRPAINYRLPIPIIHPHVRIPAGPIAQLQADNARQAADIATLRTNQATIRQACEAQYASLKQRADDDAAKLAETTRTLARAQHASAAAQQTVTRLMRPLASNDKCKRMDEADARFLESLGQ